jgi:hypothetical protein
LEEFDDFINEKFEYAVSPDNSNKEDIKNDIDVYEKIIESDPSNEKAK